MMDKERCAFQGRARIRSSLALAFRLGFRMSCFWKNCSVHQFRDWPAKVLCITSDFMSVSDHKMDARGSAGSGWCTCRSPFRSRHTLLEAELLPVLAACLACTLEPSGLHKRPFTRHSWVCRCAGHAMDLIQSINPWSTRSLFLQSASAELVQT